MSRSMNAQKATRISPSAMEEVQSALSDYWAELDASDLSEASKGIYMANADNFVRWMRNDFTLGSRNTPWKRRSRDPNGEHCIIASWGGSSLCPPARAPTPPAWGATRMHAGLQDFHMPPFL